MAQYKIPDPYDKIECPYDPSHMVDAKRFQRHLMKCGRQHPNAKVKTCPFNARHVVKVEEYSHHLMNCSDKATIQQDLTSHRITAVTAAGWDPRHVIFKQNACILQFELLGCCQQSERQNCNASPMRL